MKSLMVSELLKKLLNHTGLHDLQYEPNASILGHVISGLHILYRFRLELIRNALRVVNCIWVQWAFTTLAKCTANSLRCNRFIPNLF